MERLRSEERQARWDRIWLAFTRDIALRCSKDPSTRCGAVIVGPGGDVVSMGYNGFARGVQDLPERYADRAVKYGMVLHSELNAILFADRPRLVGATLYTWPFMSCSNCAAAVCQVGIARCVAPHISSERAVRWGESLGWAKTQFEEAGVSLCLVEGFGDE